MKLARQRGVEKDSVADAQLSEWMTTRPGPAVFAHATRLISAMLDAGSAQVTGGLSAEDLVAYCEKIASASGGIFGMRLGSISPDEKLLYIADSGKPHHVRVFDVKPDNTLVNGRVFCTIDPGVPDGLR